MLQPFAANQKLSDALIVILNYFQLQAREPVTIIFEDRVDAAHQHLIKEAFVTSKTWALTFNPDVYDVGFNGWPTLSGFITLTKPLIVLTSNRYSPDFAYQWKYMSENVYGDASLDKATWMNPRGGSAPLDQLALCALNHFPTWSASSFTLTAWLARATQDNAASLLKSMVDACNTQWKRYPNYINAGFWEIPTDALFEATVYMNQKLHGTPSPVLRIENGRAILEDIDHSRLLQGNWDRATRWIDHHLGEICLQPSPDQPGPLVHQLTDVVNLALVVTTLHLVLPSASQRSAAGSPTPSASSSATSCASSPQCCMRSARTRQPSTSCAPSRTS